MFIIHPEGDGVALLYPSVPEGRTIHDVARKDVPAGVPYRLISLAELPQDPAYRAAWRADFSEPDGIGVGADAWHAENSPE